ncbi:hypothetical protein Moror_7833 [Moniliophthora roreri MCA 2997]|uniref:Uncharacterized protein n=2 Tax=Moniliophthora roreri TaxID=221103 RepID=V2YEH0_MONRO|nr:hypothetical protein Moror_7833 [Moniliophthora roreri MCA 2997]
MFGKSSKPSSSASQARPSTTERPSYDTSPHDVLDGRTIIRDPYPAPAPARARDYHCVGTAAPSAPEARTKQPARGNVVSHKAGVKVDEKQVQLELGRGDEARFREAEGMGNGPLQRPALVRQAASDTLPKSLPRPVLATNRTLPPTTSNPFPLHAAQHQPSGSQTQVSPFPGSVEFASTDRSVPCLTNPFDNNKPLEPLAGLSKDDYKRLPKNLPRRWGYKPSVAQMISDICPWRHSAPPKQKYGEERIRPVKNISPLDASEIREDRQRDIAKSSSYRRAVEQSTAKPVRSKGHPHRKRKCSVVEEVYDA